MKCKNCGYEVDDKQNFCPSCGCPIGNKQNSEFKQVKLSNDRNNLLKIFCGFFAVLFLIAGLMRLSQALNCFNEAIDSLAWIGYIYTIGDFIAPIFAAFLSLSCAACYFLFTAILVLTFYRYENSKAEMFFIVILEAAILNLVVAILANGFMSIFGDYLYVTHPWHNFSFTIFTSCFVVVGYIVVVSLLGVTLHYEINEKTLKDAPLDLYIYAQMWMKDKTSQRSNTINNNTNNGSLKTNRSFITFILLSFITCGIYTLYFIYNISKDINIIAQDDGDNTPGVLAFFLLSLITCGLYSFYWLYKLGNRIQNSGYKYGLRINENGNTLLLWSIIGIVCCGIGTYVSYYFIIKNMNILAYEYNKSIE